MHSTATGPRVIALLSASALLWHAEVRAQLVQGLVLYAPDDRPVALATVRLLTPSGQVLATDLSGFDGHFVLTVAAEGDYFVQVEHLAAYSEGQGPVHAGGPQTPFLIFHLEPKPFAIEGLAVEVEGRPKRLVQAGFYDRQLVSTGFFLTPEQVERRHPIRASDLLQAVPGVRYTESSENAGLGGYPLFAWAERSRPDGKPCFPRIIVDGMTVEYGGTAVAPSQGFNEIVRASEIVAMEIYRSPTEFPAQFGGLVACGVIVIWTRTG